MRKKYYKEHPVQTIGRSLIYLFCIWTAVFFTNKSVTIYFVGCSIHPKCLYICSAVPRSGQSARPMTCSVSKMRTVCNKALKQWIGVSSSCDSKYIITANWVDNYFAENVGRMNHQKNQWTQKTPKDCGSSVKDGLAYLGHDTNQPLYF